MRDKDIERFLGNLLEGELLAMTIIFAFLEMPGPCFLYSVLATITVIVLIFRDHKK